MPRIVKGAIDKIFDGMRKICIRPHIGRIFTAQLQSERRERTRRRALDRLPAGNRTCEIRMVHRTRGKNARRVFVRQHKIGEQPGRQIGGLHGLFETLANENCLRSMFEYDGVAGHQRRHNAIDRCQIGIVPRRDHQHDAHGGSLDKPREPFDRLGRREAPVHRPRSRSCAARAARKA